MIIRRYFPSFILFVPVWVLAQICEPEYQVPLVMHVNSVNGEMVSSDASASVGSMAMTIGQPLIVNSSTDNSSYSSAQGFWSYYLTEPLPPELRSSDGDYTDMILLDWDIQDDLTGPPVTGDDAIIYRNGFALETVPIAQNQYLDFNVFAGTIYTYRVEVTNDLGSSQDGDDAGYLDPNGVITGQILTSSGNAVDGAKVTLDPNLGRSAKFSAEDGAYIYWYDVDSTSNLQFSGLEGDYTIETWFRSVQSTGSEQTIFAAVDSGTAGHYILLELTTDGQVAWTHSADGTEANQVTIESPDTYVAGGSPFYHLAVVLSSGTMIMYIDGARVAMDDAGADHIGTTVEMIIGKLGPSQHERYLNGYLDDLRVWGRAVDWSDIIDDRKMTLSGDEDDLAGYWKFDGLDGEIVVDISIDSLGSDNNNDAATCNIERSELISPVYVGAETDTNGNYAIRSVYYGDGTTFTATPSQETVIGRSLELDGEDMYVDFETQRIDLTSRFTVEGWFKTETVNGMTIFHAIDPSDTTTQVLVELTSLGTVGFSYFGGPISGTGNVVDDQWHHWAMTGDISTDTVSAYLDGEYQGYTLVGGDTISDLSRPFFGAYQGEGQWFNGFLDEMRVWDDARSEDQISGTMNQVLTGDELGLRNYWNFNEGESTVVNDNGGGLVTGEIIGMDDDDAWSLTIPLDEVFEHYYDPESRQVTLNYSNTSVDLVNFTDNSLIPVTGYVRYNNTSCVIEGAEILLDFESIVPPVYTDSEGKFTVDIEPGSSGDLISVSYSDHEFTPTYIELPLLTGPLTGQYFDDLTTRTASGTVGGGTCGVPLGDNITVTLSAVDGCIEEVIDVDSLGAWVSGDLPPIIYNVSVYHPSEEIDDEFTADTMSLEDSDRTRNYTYYSDLNVEFVDGSTRIAEGFDDDGLDDCDIDDIAGIDSADAVLKQRFQYSVDFRVYQEYYGDTCDVDTFDIFFTNHISGGSEGVVDSASIALGDDEEIPPYYFNALYINRLSSDGGTNDYQVSISVVVSDNTDHQASDTYWAFVIGDEAIPNESFTVTSSAEPWYVLRVPPGDASYTEFSTEQKICRSNVVTATTSDGFETENTLHMGFESESCVGIGYSFCTSNSIDADIGSGFSTSTTVTDIDETEECLTVSNTYTASGMGLITGDDATVFIGGGKTMSLGISYYLHLDDCAITIDTVLSVGSSEVSNVYMFEKYYIENFLIPSLYAEAQGGIEGSQEGYDYFTALMDEDSAAVADAVDETVYSFGGDSSLTSIVFSAGASYDYSFETGQSFTNTHSVTMESELEVSAGGGFLYAGFGFSTANSANRSTESEEETSVSEETGETIGFHVGDDDIGDAFAFTMKRDPVWGMPVFDLTGGQSSCPWEDGTLTRQSCAIVISGAAEAFDIPPDEAASFILQLQNISETGEDQTYELSVLGETNLDGAEVTSSGVNLNENELIYMIEGGTYLEIEVSIERGPTEYEYSGITLQLAPQCEDEIADAIGSGADPQNAGYAELSVSFIEPCSISEITFPYDDWLVDGSHGGDTLNVTVGGYDLDTASFSTLSLEYRAGGYGDFYPVETIDRDSLIALGVDYAIFAWNISPEIVPDGSYELRAVVGCSGDDHDGVSSIVEGMIDRTGPEVLGLPSPTDGILNVGDVISIEFDEPVDCEAIIISNPDLALQNTLTSQWLNLEYTCGDNMITMVYPDGNQYIENQTLRAYVNRLFDLFGNAISDTITWEFFVNNNPVGWVGTDISNIVIYVDEEYSTTRQVTNYGGSNHSWYAFGGRDISEGADEYPDNILDIPEWLDVAPLSGTLEPGSSEDITIGLTEGLGYGTYSTDLYLGVTGEGDEPLGIDIRKLCYEPDWTINPSEFEYSMSMTAILLKHLSPVVIDTSTDTYDMVGAFVGDELRGVATVEYLPELESLSNFHPYEIFLTIYSNEYTGEDLSFKVWNASGCALLGQIEEDFVFTANSIEGSLTSPVTLTATSQIVFENALPSGWTWMSLNTVDDDMSVNYLLSSLSPAANDIIKTDTAFAQYSEGSDIWVGDLDSLSHQKAYLLRISDQDTMATIGYAVDVELDTIDIFEGWNWIGFTPQESYSINDALGSLDSVQTGDLIKSQYGFAEYLENYGWFGSIDYMDPHLGYLLRASNSDILLYPFTVPEAQVQEVIETPTRDIADNVPDWSVDPHEYSGSMSVTGMISVFDTLQSGSLDMVGAFLGDECRGIAHPQYVEPLDGYFVFLTIYGNDQEAGNIVFQVYNEETDEVLYVPESLPFGVNDIVGSLSDPFIWDARYLAVGDPGYVPDVFSLAQNYPNPFNPVTRIGYGIPEQSDVRITIYNLLGEEVATIVDGRMEPGYYFTVWDSRNHRGSLVSAGMYLYQIRADNFVKTRKLILIK